MTEFFKHKIVNKEDYKYHGEFKPQHGWISRLIKYFEEITVSDFRKTLKNRADLKERENFIYKESEDGNIIEVWLEFIDNERSNYFISLTNCIRRYSDYRYLSKYNPALKVHDELNKKYQKFIKFIPNNHLASLTIEEKNIVNCLTKCKETIEEKCICLDKEGPSDEKNKLDLSDESDMSDEFDMSEGIAKFTSNYDSDQFSECSQDNFIVTEDEYIYRITSMEYNESYLCEKCKDVLFKRVIY